MTTTTIMFYDNVFGQQQQQQNSASEQVFDTVVEALASGDHRRMTKIIIKQHDDENPTSKLPEKAQEAMDWIRRTAAFLNNNTNPSITTTALGKEVPEYLRFRYLSIPSSLMIAGVSPAGRTLQQSQLTFTVTPADPSNVHLGWHEAPLNGWGIGGRWDDDDHHTDNNDYDSTPKSDVVQ